MKYTLKIILALMFIHLSGSVYAQKIYPDKSVKIDKKMVEQYRKMKDDIDSMPLKCDTVFIRPFDKDSVFYRFNGTYFDEKGRLRKYSRKEIVRDGSHECITMYAYYNEEGDLIYLFMDTEDHCNSGMEFYYIHKGRIIDFEGSKYCDCCDEEMTKKEINRIRPSIGSPLKLSINWELYLVNFTHANTFLKIMKNKEYSPGDEFGLIE